MMKSKRLAIIRKETWPKFCRRTIHIFILKFKSAMPIMINFLEPYLRKLFKRKSIITSFPWDIIWVAQEVYFNRDFINT